MATTVGTDDATILVDQISANLTGYSVQEDATPLDPSVTTGGVGQIDYDTPEVYGPEGSIQLTGLDVELRDPYRGVTMGTVNDVSGQDGIVSVTADGRLNSLIGTTTAVPMVDTLQNVVLYYLALGGITSGIYVDPAVAYIPLAVPGFNDEIWLRLKQLLAVHRAEVALVSNKVVVRPIRSFVSDVTKKTDFKWTVSKGDPAQFVEVTYYGNTWVTDGLVYPYTADERANMQSWEVPPGATIEDDLNLSVSLATIEQPRLMNNVPQNYGTIIDTDADGQPDTGSGTLAGSHFGSVYSVYDANNRALTTQDWYDNGGNLTLTINPDTTSVHVKITAPANIGSGPYRIVGRAVPDDGSAASATAPKKDATSPEAEDYPSLFISGSGVFTDPKVVRVPTGVTPDMTVNLVGTTVQVPAVTNIDDAYRVAIEVAKNASSTKQQVSGTLTSINRIGSSGAIDYPTVGEFDAATGSETIGTFDSDWTGKTFSDFDASQYESVKDTFDNQTFGNVAGARLRHQDAMYRISTATIADDAIEFTALSDTTFGDFDAVSTGRTIADFNTRFQGKGFTQYARIPLNTKASTTPVFVPPATAASYPDTFYPDTEAPA